MKKKFYKKLFLASAVGVVGVAGSISIQAPTFAQENNANAELETKANEFIKLASESKWEDAYKLLNEKLQAAATKEMIAATYDSYAANFGKTKSITLKDVKKNSVHTRVTFSITGEVSPYELYFNFDKNGKIDDFSIGYPTYPYSAPSYDHPENYTEKEVVVGSKEFPLPGVLTLPKGEGPFPVVVLVQGSGPHDMDSTFFGNKPFRDIAVGLANDGIAVLRYEKRTKVYPFKTGTNPKFTIQDESVLDANYAVDTLKSMSEVDAKNIYVLGHSQGGFALPLILENDKNKDIKGGIVVAGPAGKFQDLLLWQNEQSLEKAKKANAPKEQIEALETSVAFWKEQIGIINDPKYTLENPPSPTDFQLGLTDWWYNLRDIEAPEVSKKQSVPLFVVQGGKDFQVPASHLELWKDALKERDNVSYKLYPNMHHFLADNPNATGSTADYMAPANVSEQLISDIGQWVKTGAVEEQPEEKPEVGLPQYKDYEDNQYWSQAFTWAIQEGIIKGYQNENLLKPNNALNESQYLTVFFRYTLGEALKDESIKNIYALAKEKGLPVKESAFAELSLQEAAVLISKSITNKDMTVEESVKWLFDNKILDGLNVTGNESLTQSITRAQFVTVLYRIHEANLMDK
ncbi:S-layer family protein [Ureibacillus xyleni]|uniref:S-layer family protein n=1 Tax=Ureibacillus xyleni TaxID=614648 RepID=A0A285TR39_9BACL|nr:alpha/beta hydrolase [Ureibacillus xyleni]SOC25759.1 S-layer family protein [Ureibacillus xyleni]